MNARRKKSGARAVSASQAAPARKPSRSATARSSTSAATQRASAPRKPSTAAAKRASSAKASKPANTRLGADCTIEHAPTLHKQLADVIAARACVTLDFSAVQRCDTAGLQLLAAFLRERREAGLAVELTGTSDNFMLTADVLGLAALFGSDGGAPEVGVA